MDSLLFIEIILSQGARFLREHVEDGIVVGTFEGPSRKAVHIITSEDFIPKRTIRGYLRQLGMEDLEPGLFAE